MVWGGKGVNMGIKGMNREAGDEIDGEDGKEQVEDEMGEGVLLCTDNV